MDSSEALLQALLYNPNVFVHYTDGPGLETILSEGVIRTNFKSIVYLTKEPFSREEAHLRLFIGAMTHEGRGSHALVLQLDSGLPVDRLTDYEYAVNQVIKLHQHTVLYAGENPF